MTTKPNTVNEENHIEINVQPQAATATNGFKSPIAAPRFLKGHRSTLSKRILINEYEKGCNTDGENDLNFTNFQTVIIPNYNISYIFKNKIEIFALRTLPVQVHRAHNKQPKHQLLISKLKTHFRQPQLLRRIHYRLKHQKHCPVMK